MSKFIWLAVAVAAILLESRAAEAVQPRQAAAPNMAAPRDIAYPGVLKLHVDATDLPHAIFTVHETVPANGTGPLTLLFPQWRPGRFKPDGPLDELVGLIVHSGGQRLEWMRDPVDTFAFHIDVPPGATTVELDFQFLSPVLPREGRIVMTREMLRVEWETLALYPAGYFSRDIQIQPTLKLPDGWTAATALEVASKSGDETTYRATSFDTLVDSPLLAGKYFESFDLDPGGPARVTLNVTADRKEFLEVRPEQIAIHRALVQQAYRLFGSHHYSHYDFLLSLSDKMGLVGLEHHQSSEVNVIPKYFADWEKTIVGRDFMAHEYTHSWDGKFRRGADNWTPNFNVPMRNSLLWVYEGGTEYWGYVLGARSGLWTKQQTLDAIAAVAATSDHRVGREWRTLEDTTNTPIIYLHRTYPWRSWQRGEDYYAEALLVWLDADTLIREKTAGMKSLDDFAKTFFGMDNGTYITQTYTFDDVVAALNRVYPYDWAAFLSTRLQGHGPGAPLDGLARGGYKLVYDDTQSNYLMSDEESGGQVSDLMDGIGLAVDKDGVLTEVQWDGPAFKAGLTQGVTVMAVNGDSYHADVLKSAIKAAKGASTRPLELIVKSNDEFRTVRIDYHDGLRYPHLERVAGTPARLDDILTSRK